MGTDRVRPYILAHPAGHTCRKVALPIPFALVGDRVLTCGVKEKIVVPIV